jgi:hypothetical protein
MQSQVSLWRSQVSGYSTIDDRIYASCDQRLPYRFMWLGLALSYVFEDDVELLRSIRFSSMLSCAEICDLLATEE